MFCFALQCNRELTYIAYSWQLRSNAKLELQDVVMLIMHNEKRKGKLNEDVMKFGPERNH